MKENIENLENLEKVKEEIANSLDEEIQQIKTFAEPFIDKLSHNIANGIIAEGFVPDATSIDRGIRLTLGILMIKGIINKENISELTL